MEVRLENEVRGNYFACAATWWGNKVEKSRPENLMFWTNLIISRGVQDWIEAGGFV
jgi:hypothetical protein